MSPDARPQWTGVHCIPWPWSSFHTRSPRRAGALGAGLLPGMLTVTESQLGTVSALGAGLLVGTALAVVLPEGFEALHGAHAGARLGPRAPGRPPLCPPRLCLPRRLGAAGGLAPGTLHGRRGSAVTRRVPALRPGAQSPARRSCPSGRLARCWWAASSPCCCSTRRALLCLRAVFELRHGTTGYLCTV